MARYSYSPYEVDPLGQYQQQMQSGPRRFVSAVGRFFYRLIVFTLIVGALGGVLFALYRNDVLLTIARGAGVEAQYRSLEQRIGAPGWGTPRSIDLPPEAQAAASPASPAEAKDSPEKQGETVQAAANSEGSTKTSDGVAIVSFDSLPTTSGKSAQNTAAVDAPAAAEPPRARVEPARAPPARAARPERPEPRSRSKPAKAEKLVLAEEGGGESSRSIPLPKAPPKPEPVAKAEPVPKPEPPPAAPKPTVDPTAPRASDNPLKAAIRASMAGKKSGE